MIILFFLYFKDVDQVTEVTIVDNNIQQVESIKDLYQDNDDSFKKYDVKVKAIEEVNQNGHINNGFADSNMNISKIDPPPTYFETIGDSPYHGHVPSK